MPPNDTETDEFIRLGGMAPSGGNAQPWQVLVRPDSLELSLHPERAGLFLDVGHWGSIFAIGSFLENVCLASSWMGFTPQVEIHEFRAPSDKVATVRYVEQRASTEKDALHEQITQRHTNRHLHQGPALPEETIEALRSSIRHWPLMRVCAISEATEKKRAAAIFGKANVLLIRHHVLFSQLMRELRWSRSDADRTRDGVALSTLELPNSAVWLLRALRRFPPLRKLLPKSGLEKMPEPALLGCSHLCALTVREPLSTECLVNAGRAAQRLWLKATALQLSVQPFAALPFLVLRAQSFDGAGLSPSEARELLSLGAELKAIYSLGGDEFPLFVFRLSSPAAAASDRALRLPHRSLYSNDHAS